MFVIIVILGLSWAGVFGLGMGLGLGSFRALRSEFSVLRSWALKLQARLYARYSGFFLSAATIQVQVRVWVLGLRPHPSPGFHFHSAIKGE